MKKILANAITLIAEIICLILSILWYILDNGRYEAIIAGIGFTVSIIVSVFLRTKKEDDENKNTIELKDSDDNIIIQGNSGKISIGLGV